ncbi:MAG: phosphatidate cytidylyltransferase [Gammaproteobacteria bacterium]|nr:phosphatidate cytidylyltransferase [Gammaproteobacteria bacterium]
MLKQRVITALILAPLVVWGILSLPDGWFALLLAVVALAGFWEWSAFVTSKVIGRLAYLLAGGGLLAVLYFFSTAELLSAIPWLGVIWLLLASSLVIRYPKISSVWRESASLKAVIGLFILLPMWVSMIEIQRSVGAEFVLVLMLLIWGADTGAYFAGRAWGSIKLAPAVSPGKSWEGVIGGLLVAVIVALVASNWLELSMGTVLFGGIALIVSAVSVMGDLIESLFKRITGIKDSGQILPGHGGILDRIDSLTTAAPVFYLAMTHLS